MELSEVSLTLSRGRIFVNQENDSLISSEEYDILWSLPRITCSMSRFPEQIGESIIRN